MREPGTPPREQVQVPRQLQLPDLYLHQGAVLDLLRRLPEKKVGADGRSENRYQRREVTALEEKKTQKRRVAATSSPLAVSEPSPE